MKKQKKEEKLKSETVQCNYWQRVWRFVAIAVIVVFAVFIVVGLIKSHSIKSSFIKPTQDQIDLATKIAADKLQSSGGDVSAFQVEVAGRMRRSPDDKNPRTVLQVVFYNDTTTHTYLVDVDSGKVIMYSETEIYEQLLNPPKEHRNGKFVPMGALPRFLRQG